MTRPLRIGLTGGIGSGKSLVLKLIAQNGVPVLQTDLIGHELLKKKKMKIELKNKFGSKIFGKGGRVDRQKLAQAVFQNPQERNKLNRMTHPIIRKAVSDWMNQQARQTKPLLVVEVPLLFERGFNRSFDGVLSVSASKLVRQKRMLKRGWDRSEIQRREKAQWSQTHKNSEANWVIFNSGSRKDLKYGVARWLERVGKITANRSGFGLRK